jgi:hypothetical protein
MTFTQHNGAQLNDTQYRVALFRMSFMLSVIDAECRKQAHYAECLHAECRYAGCRVAAKRLAEDKHTSLLGLIVIYEEKCFVNR